MARTQKAFTLIELIFVIVILGILSVVAIPKLMATRDDAHVAKDIEYITGIVQEISTYTMSQNGTESDLSMMSPLLEKFQNEGRATLNTAQKSATIKIGEQSDCMTIKIDTNATAELLHTSFVSSEDRLCNITQKFIKDKNYVIVLRGRLIKY
ncbi:MAG TPA: prepilin-type N-terminal cleavage/methylation domain-containing protein [Epsilonproteobacteria bacterium]|nr:prepilin-type N-terminal cleavage/methylation domain-containing protein [Campylobacterota bacterium]